MIASLPRFFAPRQRAQARPPRLLENALVQPYVDAPATRIARAVAMGARWLIARRAVKRALALAAARARADDAGRRAGAPRARPAAGDPGRRGDRARHLQARTRRSAGMRLLYVRTLAGAQRYRRRRRTAEALTREPAALAPPWLTLGALSSSCATRPRRRPRCQNYVAPGRGGRAATVNHRPRRLPTMTTTRRRAATQALTQAWLLLAQAAEQQQRLRGGRAWLAKIDNPQRALDVQLRRASLLARQGKVAEARELIRRVPEQHARATRAPSCWPRPQLLRDAKQWAEADAVLARASEPFPNDADLLYEQAMMAEKLDHLDDMERLLRQVIALKPDHQHAYNALGYSLADRKLRLPEARELIQKALELAPASRSSPTAWAGSSTAWATATRRCACCAAPTRRGPIPRSPRTWARCCGAPASAEEAAASGAKARSRRRRTTCCARRCARLRVEPVIALAALTRGAAGRARRCAPRLCAVHAPRWPPAAAPARRGAACSGRLAAARRADRMPRRRARSRAAFELRGAAAAPASSDSLDAARQHDGAARAGRRAGRARDAEGRIALSGPRRADARGARREPAGRRPSSTGCTAGPWPRRAERAAPPDPRGFEQLGWAVDLARYADAGSRRTARSAAAGRRCASSSTGS